MRLFLSTFFLIYGGAHIYIFLRARAAFGFGLKGGLPIALLMLSMVFAPIAVQLFERKGYEFPARIAAYIGYAWLGLLFFVFTSSLAVDFYRIFAFLIRKTFDKNIFSPSPMASFLIPLAYMAMVAPYSYFEARNIRAEKVTIKTSKLPEGISSIRVAQISDVHLGLIVKKDRLERILDKVRSFNPDILVSTGDLVDGQPNRLIGLAECLREVNPRYGKYAIMGNHEYYAGIQHSIAFTEQAGFTIFRGEGQTVEGIINIAGVDDPTRESYGIPHMVSEQELLLGLPNDKFTLFLKHRPEPDKNSLGLFDLQLSGHTHGGQLFPFRLLTKRVYPYLSGLYELASGSMIYVSRGSGTWGPPMRFLAPPEVTLIEIIRG